MLWTGVVPSSMQAVLGLGQLLGPLCTVERPQGGRVAWERDSDKPRRRGRASGPRVRLRGHSGT